MTLDGEEAAYRHAARTSWSARRSPRRDRHELVIEYAGEPRPVAAPTTRGDFSDPRLDRHRRRRGLDDAGAVRRLPWYPVNDQPSDKALYDITVSRPRRGPASPTGAGLDGDHRARRRTVTTRWHLDEPAASYLVTVAIGDYTTAPTPPAAGSRSTTGSRRPARPCDDSRSPPRRSTGSSSGSVPTRSAPLGIVLTDSQSGMETQTMITLGNTDYVLSAPVIVHELVHQWYGDQTPDRLERRVDERGHDDVPAGALGRSAATTTSRGRADGRVRGRPAVRDQYGRPATTTAASSAGPTSTTRRR